MVPTRASDTWVSPGFWVNSIAINKPSGVEQNDILLCCIAYFSNYGSGHPSVTPPADWTLLYRDYYNYTGYGGSERAGCIMYYKIAGSSEPSSYTWNFSASMGLCGTILRIVKGYIVTPLVGNAHQVNAEYYSTITAPSINNNSKGGYEAAFFISDNNQYLSLSTPPSDMAAINSVHIYDGGTRFFSLQGYEKIGLPTGNTGNKTEVWSGNVWAVQGAQVIIASPQQFHMML